MSRLAVHHSSARGDWLTPPEILDRVARLGPVGLDPCSNPDALVRGVSRPDAEHLLSGGLDVDWSGRGLVFLNPPYGRGLEAWIRKMDEADEVVALLPARPDAAWFDGVWESDVVAFLRGRLRFYERLLGVDVVEVESGVSPKKLRGLAEVRGGLVQASKWEADPDRSWRFGSSIVEVIRTDEGGVGPWDSAPFPSVLAYRGPDPTTFAEATEDLGRVVRGPV